MVTKWAHSESKPCECWNDVSCWSKTVDSATAYSGKTNEVQSGALCYILHISALVKCPWLTLTSFLG